MGAELWKVIPDYPIYSCSNYGTVINSETGRVLKGSDNGLGYRRVTLRNDSGKRVVYIHRLVATLFVKNPEDKPCVNHIDNDPANNRSENLEWCTKQENTDWMIKQGRNKRTKEWLYNLHKSQEKEYKPVIAINTKTGLMLEFSYLNQVKQFGFQPSCVCRCCKGKGQSHKGFAWMYA